MGDGGDMWENETMRPVIGMHSEWWRSFPPIHLEIRRRTEKQEKGRKRRKVEQDFELEEMCPEWLLSVWQYPCLTPVIRLRHTLLVTGLLGGR